MNGEEEKGERGTEPRHRATEEQLEGWKGGYKGAIGCLEGTD